MKLPNLSWPIEAWSAWLDRRTSWHRWFAWYPVRLETGEWVWLEIVETRVDGYWESWDGAVTSFSYRRFNA